MSLHQRLLVRASSFVLRTSGRQRLSILIYHRVLKERDCMRPLELTAKQFSCQMELVSREFVPLSLSDALDLLEEGRLPDRAVCVTFDDGYADNEEVALPILRKYRIPATVFVASKFINGGRMWNDTVVESIRSLERESIDLRAVGMGCYKLTTIDLKRAAAGDIINQIKHLAGDRREEIVDHLQQHSDTLPDNLMLSDAQICSLRDNDVELGAHTYSHPILANLSCDEVLQEIEKGRDILESVISKPVQYFAYPNGKPVTDYLPEHRDIVKEMGFRAAVSTVWGVSDKNTDKWQLPRFTPWDRSDNKFSLRMVLNTRNLR